MNEGKEQNEIVEIPPMGSTFTEVLTARRETDFWKAQALLYAKELAIVNRACSKKSWRIKLLSAHIGWLQRDMELIRKRQEKEGIL